MKIDECNFLFAMYIKNINFTLISRLYSVIGDNIANIFEFIKAFQTYNMLT